MKRHITILTLLVLMLGLNMSVKAQTWDFTKTPDADVALLKAATSEWGYTESSNRYESKTAINGAIKAGGTELSMTKGLTVDAAATKIRIDVNNRMQLAGKNIPLSTPILKKGQVVKIVFASTGSTAVTFDSNTNLSGTSGFTAADKNTTQTGTGTVTADGVVSFKCTGGSVNVFSIEVTGEGGGEQGGEDTPAADDYSTTSNLTKNQAILTLSDQSKKYYNTESLSDISFDGQDVTVNLKDQETYTFKANVSEINFRKADNTSDATINNTTGGVQITEAKGWLESAYVKFDLFEGAKTYNVYVKGGQYADYTKIDDQLVRNYGTYGRADVVGLMMADYAIKVVPVDADKKELTDKGSEATQIIVKNYDRAGFAHKGTTGVGAYNDDGTLKTGAKVLYITKNNFNTVTLELNVDNKPQTFTGLGKILEAKQKKNLDTTPLSVRIIGEIRTSDVDAAQLLSDENGLQLKGNSETSEMNVTLEGIGDDATFNGFGMTFYNGTSVEMRNIAFINFNLDGVQLKGTQHAWIHHNDFFYGNAGGDADQAKGDGSLDVKDNSRYCTFSYNHFWDSGKTSLCGMKSESGENWLSYHHNWFDHSDSRHPRVRTMTVHVWNNYYDGVSKIGVGAVKGANIFVESNYFRNSKNPMLISEQGTDGRGGFADDHDGGMIKAYGNVLTGKSATTFIPHTKSATEFDAYVAETREEKVPDTYKSVVGSYTYNNFDTDATKMYEYTPNAADDVPSVVTGFYGAGRMNHGDLQWTFNNDTDDAKDAIDTGLKSKVTSYKTSLVGIFGEENAGGGEGGGDEPGGGDIPVPEGTITCSFDGASSSTIFTAANNYGDGKITYNSVYYKKGEKLDSKGSIVFTPAKDYNMTIVLSLAKTGRDVKINGTATTVEGTTNTDGNYYQMNAIKVNANTQYTITKGSAESIVMLIILDPISE